MIVIIEEIDNLKSKCANIANILSQIIEMQTRCDYCTSHSMYKFVFCIKKLLYDDPIGGYPWYYVMDAEKIQTYSR